MGRQETEFEPILSEYTDLQAAELCGELRKELVQDVSRTGGHLASNLGAVELTVALHRVFDTSKDRLVFDVGHQCYIHKMLTGRREEMASLRQYGGIAGFPKPGESIHDAFIAGHASNSVAVALGMVRARQTLGEDYKVLLLSMLNNDFLEMTEEKTLIVGLAVLMTVLSVLFNTLSFEQRHRSRMIDLSRYVVSELEDFNTMDSNEDRRINQVLSNMYDISGVDVNIYDWHGRLVSTSRAFIFENGLDGFLLNPKAYQQIVREGNLRLVQYEEIGEIHYRSVYVPLELTNGKRYVVNIPYFTQSGELNMDILLIIVISVNIAVVVVVLAFALASIVAGRVTKPLQLVNDRLSQMKLGEKNEKISYDSQDEVGEVIKAYNNMVDKLSDSMKKLARSEREGAWMGMARQIAHEIKNPLTPMKLNLQFLQRAMRNDNPEELRRRVMNVSAVLIEQIDYMTSIASAFSDFSRLQVMNRELGRLRASLEAAPEGAERVAFLHYPPVYPNANAQQVIDLLKEYDVKRCFYGHLHGNAIRFAVQGTVDGIEYRLISADALAFCPYKI